MEKYFVKNFMPLYIACGNSMVYVDQQHNLQRLKRKERQCSDSHYMVLLLCKYYWREKQ